MTRAKNYDLIALRTGNSGAIFNSKFATGGGFQLDVSKANGGFEKRLDAPSGFLPGSITQMLLPMPVESWDFNPGGPNYRYGNPYEETPSNSSARTSRNMTFIPTAQRRLERITISFGVSLSERRHRVAVGSADQREPALRHRPFLRRNG